MGYGLTATFHVGDAIEVMSKIPEKSVDLILTSPPFLALRSYLPADHPDKKLEGGSQSTPGEYIDWLLNVVEVCDRVLAPHGSLCIELGDTYSNGSGGHESGWERDTGEYRRENRSQASAEGRLQAPKPRDDGGRYPGGYSGGSKGYDVNASNGAFEERPGRALDGWPLAKSLSLIPETFRFAMVYGHNPHTGRTTEPWRLRNVIRWVRPNPPVGALGDKFRPATSELMVFCKSAKRYFDLDAVRTPHQEHSLERDKYSRAVSTMAANIHGGDAGRWGEFWNSPLNPNGAPPLDWWNIPPGGYEGAHYAVWPPELLIKPIKAMSPEKVCRQCGEPSRRIVGEATYVMSRTGLPVEYFDLRDGLDNPGVKAGSTAAKRSAGQLDNSMRRQTETLGFSDCGHDDWRPGLILDPFAGSGTTLAVATGHGRDAIGIDLDSRNVALSRDRVGSLFFEVIDAGSETDRSDDPLLAESGAEE